MTFLESKLNRLSHWFGVTLAVLVLASTANGAELAQQGRAIYNEHKEAVVTVQLTLKHQMSFGGMGSQDREVQSESTGTVISPDGLILLSLSETDPGSLMESMLGGMGQGQVEMNTEVQDVTILRPDGSETPASIILRDKTLDMAFVRPTEKPETPFEHVALDDEGAPELLDQVVTINRLGQVAARVHSVSFERIEAIVERPRTFYLPGKNPTNTALGSPAFTADGKFIGVFLMRSVKSSSSGGLGSLMGGLNMDNAAVVIVPAVDIAEGAAQAPAFDE